MKSRATFERPMGPYLVTADEIKDPLNLQVRLWVNGALMQNYNTSDMAHKISRCVEWVSTLDPLEPVMNCVRHQSSWAQSISGWRSRRPRTEPLGRLHVKIRDDLKRAWARETRLQRQEKGLEGFTPQLGRGNTRKHSSRSKRSGCFIFPAVN